NMTHALFVDPRQTRRAVILYDSAVAPKKRLIAVLRRLSVAARLRRVSVCQLRQIRDGIPHRDERQQSRPVRRLRKQDRRIAARRNEENTPPLLGHTKLFGLEHLHINAVAEALHALEYLFDDFSARD